MNIKSLHSIYFLGIGGIGMSGLARYFMEKGVNVAGYDKTRSPITDKLNASGVDIIFDDNPAMLPGNIDMVIYTPAVKEDLNIIRTLKDKGLKFYKRAEVLGMISKELPTIAVGGTHGKTTISSMIVHILKTAGTRLNGFVGGITNNYSSNYIGDVAPEWIVVEADEYDRSFLNLDPYYGVVTSMDPDHLDIYKCESSLRDAFFQFINRVDENGKILLKEGLKYPANLKTGVITYGIEDNADVYAKNISTKDLVNYFDVDGKIRISGVELKMPGRHNIENCLAAIVIADMLNIKSNTILKAFKTYSGVWRRFDIKVPGKDITYIDDYAHHPKELSSFITAVRDLLPGKRITGVFQPHLYSRTRDFASDFAKSLELLDELLLLDIYPARERPIEGVSSHIIFDKVSLKDKYLLDKEEVVGFLKKRDVEVVLTLGAGDIDRLVEPLTVMFKEKNNR